MISLGLKVDKSNKIKNCCHDMKEEDFWLLISKDKGIYAYNYEYGHLDFPEPLKYCPGVVPRTKLFQRNREVDI